ncbi:hypothetical protein PTKIN_Ptkin03bG0134400 [Pterospermum kingtungense]
MRRGLASRGDCVCCQGVVVDLDHLFRRCRMAAQVWEAFLPGSVLLIQSSVTFDEWLKLNLVGKVYCDFTQDWSAMFVVILWWLRRWRNDLVFNNRIVSIDFKIGWLRSQVREIAGGMEGMSLVQVVPQWTVKFVRWNSPPEGWIKLNMDGCCKSMIEVAGCGGILRDMNGNWLKAFTCNTGCCSDIEAEI